MTKRSSMGCAHLVNYLLGELSDRELVAFQVHANHCPLCQEELNTTLPVNIRLTEADIDIPDDKWFAEQKERLLRPALTDRKPTNARENLRRNSSMFHFPHYPYKRLWWSSVIAIVFVTVGVVSFMRLGPSGNATSINRPVGFLNKISLNPNKGYPDAQGVALVVSNHNQKNLILTVSRVPEQSKWGCYDVWGQKDGKHYSLGEFTVDHNGNGALSISLPRDGKYDSIEVTLEPYWGDNEPQGPRVLTGPWAM